MAKDIRQRISLEGGAAIRKELRDIGKDGERSLKQLEGAKAANQALGTLEPTLSNLRQSSEGVRNAFSNLGAAFSNFGAQVGAAGRNIVIAGAAVGAALAGFGALVKSAADAETEIKEIAEALGLTAREFSNLRYAAEQLGVSGEQFTSGLTRLEQKMHDARKEVLNFEKQQRALNREWALGRISQDEYLKRLDDLKFSASQSQNEFKRLGVNIFSTGTNLRSTQDVLADLSDVLKGMPDGAQRTGAALELLGRGNLKMAGALAQGSAEWRRLQKEAERVAPALSEVARRAGEELGDAFDKMSRSATSAKNAFLALFFPVTTRLIDAVTERIVGLRETLFSFGVGLAERVTPIIEDIIALIQGKDQDVRNSFILKARDAVVDFVNAVRGAFADVLIPAFNAFMAIMSTVANTINGLFGTNITGGQLAVALGIIKLTGLFGVFSATVRVAAAAVRLLWISFGPIGVAIAAVGAVATVAFAKMASDASKETKNIEATTAAMAKKTAEEFGKVPGAAQQGVQDASSAVNQIADSAVDAVRRPLQEVRPQAERAATDTTSVFGRAIDTIVGYFTRFEATAKTTFDNIVQAARTAAEEISNVFSKIEGLGFAGGGSVPGFARGGRVSGPGTSTSDSIPARLSAGEYVEDAATVRSYGVAFFEALRRRLIPVESVRALMASVRGLRGLNLGRALSNMAAPMVPPLRFAQGGLVESPAGGASGPARTVFINFEGKQHGPFRTIDDVIDGLLHVAAKSKINSLGRAPRWER